MAIANIIARGYGIASTGVKYIPVRGYLGNLYTDTLVLATVSAYNDGATPSVANDTAVPSVVTEITQTGGTG